MLSVRLAFDVAFTRRTLAEVGALLLLPHATRAQARIATAVCNRNRVANLMLNRVEWTVTRLIPPRTTRLPSFRDGTSTQTTPDVTVKNPRALQYTALIACEGW